MSSNLMDTEIGGEQTQYEAEYSDVKPHAKEAGQLGDPAQGTGTTEQKKATDEPNTHGITKADKIRYGQSIQEGGMGGKTTSSTGQANAEGGYGGTKAVDENSTDAVKQRTQQGYGGEKDMDRNVGA